MKGFALIALVAAGCGGTSGVNITKMIGPSGGTVSHSDGTSVTIPTGALSSAANITITSVDAPAPAGTVIVGPAYDFGPEGTTFASPVTITLPIDASKIPAGRTANDVLIYTAARGSSQYTVLQTGIGSGTATTTTSHFTVYLPAVLAPGAVADMASHGDLAAANCSPVFTPGTSSCMISESCNGHTYFMQCNVGGSSSSSNCFCEIDGATQSSAINVSSCDESTVEGTFFQMCGPSS